MVSCDVARDDSVMLFVSASGHGKRTKLDQFNRQGRGGQGVRGMKVTASRVRSWRRSLVQPDDEILVFSSGGNIIRTGVKEISSQGRDATGVKVAGSAAGESVVAVAPVLEAGSRRGHVDDGECGRRPGPGGCSGARCVATRAACRRHAGAGAGAAPPRAPSTPASPIADDLDAVDGDRSALRAAAAVVVRPSDAVGASRRQAALPPRAPAPSTERRYRQTVAKVDLWSVLKMSVCFYICAMAVTMVALVVAVDDRRRGRRGAQRREVLRRPAADRRTSRSSTRRSCAARCSSPRCSSCSRS